MKAGKPYRAIGANYFPVFENALNDPAKATHRQDFEALVRAGIPFIRFAGGPYWPVGWKPYRTDRAEYFRRMDLVVRAAEKAGLGLIPSLFWHVATVSDLCGERLNRLGDPKSKSTAFIRQYTGEVVRRYRDSPALWGWEMGNEYNLHADLPDAYKNGLVAPVHPTLGTMPERTPDDALTSAAFTHAAAVFARTVRQFDKTRLISTGNAIPRAAAWHNTHENNWKPDTPDQTALILRRDNPDPADTISVHIYPPDTASPLIGDAKDEGEAISLLMRLAARQKKPLFLGEFGVSRKEGPPEAQKRRFQRVLDAIVRERVPLSAFWVFNLPSQDSDWNVTFTNDRAFMLTLVGEANRSRGQVTGDREQARLIPCPL